MKHRVYTGNENREGHLEASGVSVQYHRSSAIRERRGMRQVYNRIPVYTGDVSGVCSALYELGGMVVMHDPSGCNSTYNTHDEIRWYDRDSLIFLSGLDETDAVLGSDEKLIRDIEEAAAIYSPAFIAIANSPIPYITGLDFDAVCRVIEQDTDIPAFYIMTNGMHDYVRGAGMAFLELARRFVKSNFVKNKYIKSNFVKNKYVKSSLVGKGTEKRYSGGGDNPAAEKKCAGRYGVPTAEKPLRCNILGMTPLDFAAPASTESLGRKISGAGMEIVSCWAMKGAQEKSGSAPLMEIQTSASADVNLVVSSAGLPAARYMQESFGIPYTVGIPAEGVEDVFFEAVRDAVRTGENRFPFRDRKALSRKSRSPLTDSDSRKVLSSPAVYLIGEPVIMTSLAASAERTAGARTHVLAATETGTLFTGPEDRAVSGEEDLAEILRQAVESSFKQTEDSSSGQAAGPGSGNGRPVCVIADPCYAGILPEGCRLIPLPHLAFSGRIYLREMKDLFSYSFLRDLSFYYGEKI